MNRIRVMGSLLLAFLLIVLGSPAMATPVFSPVTGSYYEYVLHANFTWSQASAAAQASSYQGIQGRLATITSAQENAFIVNNVLPQTDLPEGNQYWIGGVQPDGSLEPAGGWSWITGEPFVYTNWDPGEPNNDFQGENENRIEIYAQPSGTWNDLASDGPLFPVGYLIEYPPSVTSVPEPAMGAALMVTWVLTLRRRCV